MENPVPRHLGHGEAHRKKMAVDVIRERLQTPKAESDLRKVSELLGRTHLQAQPWRRPRRPGAESASTMELIRRVEAHLKAH
jgi:hypothetical protein